MAKKRSEGYWEVTKTALWAAAIAIVVRTVAFEPFSIPSGSMVPTLLVGDYLFVSKYSYGYSRHSLPFSLPLIPGRIFAREPDRGDVAVFKLPTDNETDYIKRIIGLPGDTIQVRDGILYINSEPVKRERVNDFVQRDINGFSRRLRRFIETLPNGRRHAILDLTDRGDYDNTRIFRVPEGHYFAMGDNRDNSQDSRSAVGFIPRKNLVGRAEFMFFSINGSTWEFWKWPWTIRFGRLFAGIE